MRKNLKLKRRCCAMCKGRKRGWWCRWKARERMLLREFEREWR